MLIHGELSERPKDRQDVHARTSSKNDHFKTLQPSRGSSRNSVNQKQTSSSPMSRGIVSGTQKSKRISRNANARFIRTFQLDKQNKQDGGAELESSQKSYRNASFTRGSVRSQLSGELRQITGSGLRWELQSRDTHMGHLLRNEVRIQQQFEKEKRYATIFEEFQMQKQADRDAKERFRLYQKQMLEEQRLACQQMRQENINNLNMTRQIFTAEKNYQGSLHKRDRDQTWATKRLNDQMRVQKNHKFSREVKEQVDSQKYKTNVQRVEDILRQSQERYESDLESLQNLSIFVQERGQWIEDNERKILENIEQTSQAIKKIRQYPKEKDVVLSYLEKRSQQRFSPAITWQENYHDFNRFTPIKSSLKVNFNNSPNKTPGRTNSQLSPIQNNK